MIEQARGPAARGAGAAATRASRRACDVDASKPPAAARQTASARMDALATVDSVACETLGTRIEPSAPLMSAGLDSLAAAAFVSALAARLSVDIAPTELFDHPTLSSIASCVSTHVAIDDDDVPAVVMTRLGSCVRVAERSQLPEGSRTVVAAWSFQLAGSLSSDAEAR